MRLVAKRSPEPGAWRVCWSACWPAGRREAGRQSLLWDFPGLRSGMDRRGVGTVAVPAKITALEAEAEPSSRVGIWVVTPGAQLEPPTTLTPRGFPKPPITLTFPSSSSLCSARSPNYSLSLTLWSRAS